MVAGENTKTNSFTFGENMFKKSYLMTTSLVTAMAIGAPAYAQDVDDEIIVTATKRETTLQQTPIAVTVTDAITIDRAKILDINDLQSVVPSLRVNQLQSTQNSNFIIRGSGNGANNGGIEGSVGVFVDGVYRSRSSARVNDLPKLQRVEVLKGPQSTLFGKNASAGVISVVTAEPSYEQDGYVEATYGNYNQTILKGYYSNSLGGSDTTAFSLGGSINKRDGYFESADPNLSDTNDRNRWNVRGQFLYEPSDNLKFRLIGDYSEIDEKCCGVTNVVAGPVSGIFQLLSGLPTPATASVADPFSYTTFQNSDSINEIEDYGLSFHVDAEFDGFDVTSISSIRNNDSFYLSDADYSRTAMLDGVSSTLGVDTITQELRFSSNSDSALSWMLGGFLFLEEVSQGSTLDYGAALRPYIDFLAGGPEVLGVVEAANGIAPGTLANGDVTIVESFEQDNTAYSFFGTADYEVSDRLTLTAGLNYTNDKKKVSGDTVNPDLFSSLDLAGAPGFNALVLGGLAANFPAFAGSCIDPTTGAPFGALPFTPTNVGLVSMSPACFLDPNDLSITAPGNLAYQGFQGAVTAGVSALDLSDPTQNPFLGLQGFQTQPPFVGFPNNVEDGRTRDDKITWNLRAAYQLNDTFNVYASASTGFKASSWNLSRDSRPFASDFAALGSAVHPNVAPGTRYAGPEEVLQFELGVKSKFDGGFLNIALFDQTFEGLQTNAFVGSSFVLTNAGELSVKGIEIDGQYELFDGFKVNAAATLLDPEFTDFRNASGPAGPIDRTGEKPDNVSDVSLSLGATYSHEFDNGMSGYIRADWQYEGPATQARNLTPDSLDISATIPGLGAFYNPAARTIFEGYDEREQSLVNGSMGLEINDEFTVQVWGRNLFNDRYFSTLFPGVFQFGVVNAYPSQPRTYGVSARYNF